MFCSKCGRASDGSAFCVGCGSSMAADSGTPKVQVVQPNVGAPQYQQPSYQNTYQPQQAYMPQQTYLPPQGQYLGPQQTSGKAIASLVLSLLGISIMGVIFGHIAASEIKRSAGRIGGSGLATAGIVLGWLGMVGWVFYWIFFAALFSSSYYY